MMVALLSEGRHPGFYLRELGICAVCSMSTSTTREGKGEPCVGKNTNSTAMNESTKALQIVKYLEGTPDGNPDLLKAAIRTVPVEPPQELTRGEPRWFGDG